MLHRATHLQNRPELMNTYLPTLRQLQYLVALRDQGHFGKAAEACFVTQSTLSAGIQELERVLTEDKVFDFLLKQSTIEEVKS